MNWYRITKRADWGSFAEVRSDFSHADIVWPEDRIQYPREYLQADRADQLQNQTRVHSVHPHPCRVQQGSLEVMSTTTEIRDSVYAELLAKSLPRPIRTDTERARFAETLLGLDDREDLSPEEEALVEVLTLLIEDYEEKNYPLPRRVAQRVAERTDGRTWTETQGHLACSWQQGCRH